MSISKSQWWTNVVTLSNIHESSLFTSRFQLYKSTKVSTETPLQNYDTCPLIVKSSNLSNVLHYKVFTSIGFLHLVLIMSVV